MLKLIRYYLSIIILLLVLGGCNSTNTTEIPQMSSPPYLGQEPPGMEPEVFAPGIISSVDFEYSGTFSPDGSEYYFNRYFEDTQTSSFLFSKIVDGKWTTPEQLAFTEEYQAGEPHLTFDNKKLYFMWRHPVPAGLPEFPVYFFVERTPNGWSEPKYAGQGMFLSSDMDGQLYTTDMSRSAYGTTYLARVTVNNDGLFTNYEQLPIQAHLGTQAHPCIAPDGSYLIFDVNGGEYLFVSFKNPDGTWGDAIDLTEHGFDKQAGGAYVSPDGKYLFFALRGDIWWVDINVIEDLRP